MFSCRLYVVLFGVASVASEPPSVSLNIKQLSGWTWINQNQGRKQYDFTFTEDEAQFDCVLNNPTEHEETYAIYFFMDEPQNGTNITVTLQPHGRVILSGTFKLINDKRIVCKAVIKKGKGMDLLTEINLRYVPPTPMLNITGPEKLLRSSNTMYHYNFTDHEIVDFKCSLNNAVEGKKNYDVVLFNYNVSNKTQDYITSSKVLKSTCCVSNTFRLEKEAEAISCAVFEINDDDKNILFLKTRIEVRLHYYPPRKANRESHTPPPTQKSSTTVQPPTQKSSTTDVTERSPKHACPSVSWAFWLALSIAVLLLVALVLTILKCRKTAKKLEENESRLRKIEEEAREVQRMAERRPVAPPPELVYDSVYAHGAGLLRRPKK